MYRIKIDKVRGHSYRQQFSVGKVVIRIGQVNIFILILVFKKLLNMYKSIKIIWLCFRQH